MRLPGGWQRPVTWGWLETFLLALAGWNLGWFLASLLRVQWWALLFLLLFVFNCGQLVFQVRRNRYWQARWDALRDGLHRDIAEGFRGW